MAFEPIVLVDTSEVRPGRLEDLRIAMKDLATFVESNEPRPIAYQMFLAEDSMSMTVVQIHPDSASVKTHMEVAAPMFAGFADLVHLREMHIYGSPSDHLVELMRRKAELLGGASLGIHDLTAGFVRFDPR